MKMIALKYSVLIASFLFIAGANLYAGERNNGGNVEGGDFIVDDRMPDKES